MSERLEVEREYRAAVSDLKAQVERERAIRKEAIRDNRDKTEAMRELQAEVARLTDKGIKYDLDQAGIAQREVEAVELVALRAEVARRDLAYEDLKREYDEMCEKADKNRADLAAARAERDGLRACWASLDQRFARELDEMRAMWDKDSAARHRLTRELDASQKARLALTKTAEAWAADLAAARAQADKMAECLDRLIECADDSDGAQYGTLSTNFVRDMALAALPTPPEADA